MTNIKDNSYPNLRPGDRAVRLECAHIIPHYLGEESESIGDVTFTIHMC